MDKSVEKSLQGGSWIFLGSIALSVTGFIFWLFISRILGAEIVGIASTIVSASWIAIAIFSAGLGIAVLRETAARGRWVVAPSIALASLLAMGGGAGALILSYVVGYGGLALAAAALASLSIISTAIAGWLLGDGRFKSYFLAVLAGSTSKLVAGVMRAFAGLGVMAGLLAIAIQPVVLIAWGIALALRLGSPLRALRVVPKGLGPLVRVSASNYLYMFSGQMMVMLTIYIYSLYVGDPESTGVLYIGLMMSTALASLPVAVSSAGLAVGARQGGDPFAEALRLSLAAVTPMIILAAALPGEIMGLLGSEFYRGSTILRLLIITVVPFSAIFAAVARLNKEGRTRTIAAWGGAMLGLNAVLIAILSQEVGVWGAAVAYTVTNIIFFIPALSILGAWRGVAPLEVVAVLAAAASHYLGPIAGVAIASAAYASFAVMGLAAKPGEVVSLAVFMIRSVVKWREG